MVVSILRIASRWRRAEAYQREILPRLNLQGAGANTAAVAGETTASGGEWSKTGGATNPVVRWCEDT